MFNQYANHFGFTLHEFTALLGSHALIDSKNCLNQDKKTNCDPLINDCKNISMYYWDNSYYTDLCTQNINIEFNAIPTEFKITKQQFIKNELCKYTSSFFRDQVKNDLINDFEINIDTVLLETPEQAEVDLIIETDTTFAKPVIINRIENNNPEPWLYTTNDGYLGLACQNKLENNDINNQIKNSMNKFKDDENLWDNTYAQAYKKMINNNVRWFKLKSNGFQINGKECYSGYKIINNQEYCKTSFLPTDSFYE
jgi:hypothetical protein